MLILENVKPKLEQSIEQQQKKHIKLLGRQRKNKSHILWSYNVSTRELKPAIISQGDTLHLTCLNKDVAKREIERFYSKVIVEENCIYFQALNKKNALKKLQPLT
jgi:hypothetical protein